MVGTTFAFQQLNQTALNPDRVSAFPGGRIHDVFELRDAQDRSGERNKNVFAENYGTTPIGVRVQFQEFLMLHGVDGMGIMNTDEDVQMNINEESTWSIARFDADLNRLEGSTAATIGGYGIDWTLGHTPTRRPVADETYYFMPTFNHVSRPLTGVLGMADVTIDPAIPLTGDNASVFASNNFVF